MSELQLDAAKLQRLMDEQGLNDRSLAELVGVSKGTIHALRASKHKNTSPGNLKKIAEVLGTTADYLLVGGVEDDGRVEMKLPESIRQLALIATRLSNVRREELLRIAATLEEIEREQPVYSAPSDLAKALLGVSKEVGASSVLIQLEAMLRQTPPARLIDLLAGDRPKDSQ